MAWDHLSITKPHLVYIILGGFTSLFMLCSTVIKERLYIGEATVATICGIIFGPHAAGLIDPNSWGSVDVVTIEFSRVVLVVQCFAVGVELPKFYMEKHWRSVVFLLVPVMTFGWLITSLIVWWMVPPLSWLESLVVAACVTATDPVLASSVVGKGKFAKRVPKHLRDLLSAESGCNDGMAFPFVYLSLHLLQDHLSAREVTFNWIVITILYECIFGAIFGFVIGYLARHGIKYAEQHELIDRESFLVFYFVLALFCAGSGSILGVDDLLVGFACGVGFSNDGWFTQKTEESHVSNVIDLLINLAYFVFFGTIIPWSQFNNAAFGLSAWRLVVLAIFVILFRRIPAMLALKPLIPDIKTWREALFAGHFGPIGVGAIFVAILARAELEQEKPVPMSDPPTPGTEFYTLALLVWPIVTFLVVASILVHGSSIAVFTLGKRINTLTLTMSYTTAPEDGPSWMNRLPRISSVSRSQAKSMSDTDLDEMKSPEYPPGTLPPIGLPGNFLRRQREDEKGHARQDSRASSVGRRRKAKRWDSGIGPGGPISESAIFPQRRSNSEQMSSTVQGDSSSQSPVDEDVHERTSIPDRGRPSHRQPEEDDDAREATRKEDAAGGDQDRPGIDVYDEGDNIIVENEQGDVLAVEKVGSGADAGAHAQTLKQRLENELEPSGWSYKGIKQKIGDWRAEELEKRKEKHKSNRRHEPARAYQFGNTIIVEDEDGEVVKKYQLPSEKSDNPGYVHQSLKYMGMGGLVKSGKVEKVEPPAAASSSQEGPEEAGEPSEPAPPRPGIRSVSTWTAALARSKAGDRPAQKDRKKSMADQEDEDDKHIRFTIGGVGQRMTKEDFIREMRKYDKGTRHEIMDRSNASNRIKTLVDQEGKTADDSAQSSTRRGKTGEPAEQAKPQQNKAAAPVRPKEAARTSTAQRQGGEDSRGRSPAMSTPATSTAMEESPRPTGKEVEPSSRDEPETAVERRRRLAVLEGVDDADDDDVNDDVKETPAERRRREAALGMSSRADDDSDDDDTPRVPQNGGRRGIRFAV